MYALTVSAVLAGVTDLQPTDTEDSPYHYSFRVQCTSCREVHPKLVSFNRWEKHSLSGSRGDANFVWKCGFCNRENSASFTNNPSAYTESQAQQQIIQFDCRGLEFTEFIPDGEWQAKGAESNYPFTGIDLQEGEWYDYDEKAGEEVSVTGLKWEIKRV
ncbi:uncharacterized protein CIMG_00259 [Coccidioides immitis RS]|uniref:DUF866 domain-containing protein n=1 Tax=Coccidioides immitis (strain RS) TaxID=246410 RepID=J3KGM2_COCIM|nr:uncharacterized protein CIMG_00259 [Coccidioides immitis RS]EAS34905.3 hypothetical protein CIMG_00259 [Coccidioides immitis RS]QVM10457.1 hypothetical protein D8B26_005118 [Coccidioides posadasii str. Silveira]TPX26785.1 hypothetical protein DIZ76_012247 [Coccidioides immitis]